MCADMKQVNGGACSNVKQINSGACSNAKQVNGWGGMSTRVNKLERDVCSGVRRREVESATANGGSKEEAEDEEEEDYGKLCIICLTTPYNTVLLPCGHLYLCHKCATDIKNRAGNCPACRTHIQSFHRVYTPD